MWLCATIDLSRAYEPDSDEADDSDDEADDSDDDSDDDSYPDSETHAFCEVCDGVYPHSYHPQGEAKSRILFKLPHAERFNNAR